MSEQQTGNGANKESYDPTAKMDLTVKGIGLLRGADDNFNPEEGMRLLREAMEAGNLIARMEVLLCLFGRRGYYTANPEEGLKILRHYAEHGDKSAQRDLADRLLYGRGCDASPAEGLKWLRELLVQPDSQGDSHKWAQLQWAKSLIDGRGCPVNRAEGMRLLRCLAEIDFDAM